MRLWQHLSQLPAPAKLSEIAHQQAAIMAYNEAFDFIGIALAVSVLAVLLTRHLAAAASSDAGAAH